MKDPTETEKTRYQTNYIDMLIGYKAELSVLSIPVFILIFIGFAWMLSVHAKHAKHEQNKQNAHMNRFFSGNTTVRLQRLEIDFSRPFTNDRNMVVTFDDPESMKYLQDKYSARSTSEEDCVAGWSYRTLPTYFVFTDGTRVLTRFGFVFNHPHVLITYPLEDEEYGISHHAHLPLPVPKALAALDARFAIL